MKIGYAYILLIHLILALALWRPDFIRRIEARVGIPTAEAQYFYKKTRDYHRTMDSSIPSGAVIFIGDSITQALATSAISTLSVNFGIGSDTTNGVLNRLPFYKSMERSKAVVLAIGINDIHQKVDSRETLRNYKNILDRISIDTPVVTSSVLPIGVEAERNHFANTDILSLNNEIEHLVKNYKNVSFLDVNEALLDATGYLHPDYHLGDGIHLSDKGYKVLIEALKNSLSTIQEN